MKKLKQFRTAALMAVIALLLTPIAMAATVQGTSEMGVQNEMAATTTEKNVEVTAQATIKTAPNIDIGAQEQAIQTATTGTEVLLAERGCLAATPASANTATTTPTWQAVNAQNAMNTMAVNMATTAINKEDVALSAEIVAIHALNTNIATFSAPAHHLIC